MVSGVLRVKYPSQLNSSAVSLQHSPAGWCCATNGMSMQVAPEWERLTAHIEADPESKERLGWVREMYAFSTAVALKNIELDIVACPECPLISQASLAISCIKAKLPKRFPCP